MTSSHTKQLNRPPLCLSPTFDPVEYETQWYQWWEKSGFFKASPQKDKKSHTIMIPLPNVTGALHLGHALNNSLQDFLTRRARMQGFESLWQPGTDHAGVATESVVKKRLWAEENLTPDDLGYEKMLERIWLWKEEYEKRILSQLRRIGSSLDWDRTEFTMSERCTKAVRYVFLDLFKEGLVYKGKRLINWSTGMKSALSNDELVHKNVAGHFWTLKYPLEGENNLFIEVATTRPETMLGDTAVAVHPNPREELQKRLEKAILGKDTERQEALEERIAKDLPRLEKFASWIGKKVCLPLTDRVIPIIGDAEAVDPEKGTGAVKITPAHDPNDYACGQRNHLPMINLMEMDGTLNEKAGKYAGLFISKEARQAILQDLDALNLLVEVKPHEHEVAHCYRSDTPIEPYLSDQWFVSMQPLVTLARDCYTEGNLSFYPEHRGKDYLRWLDSTPDWCISRQIWWGHRIPVWKRTFSFQDCPVAIPKDLGNEIIEDTSWSQLPFSQSLGENAFSRMQIDYEKQTLDLLVCVSSEQKELEKELEADGFLQENDVLDTWFSSQLWPLETLGWPEKTEDLDYFYPTTTLVTARDILALWVARMVMMGMKYMGKTPFHNVLITGTIQDEFGNIMSKSRGNGFDPVKAIEGGREIVNGQEDLGDIPKDRIEYYKAYGTDALRYGLLSMTSGFAQDLKLKVIRVPRKENEDGIPAFDVEIPKLEEGRRFCNKIWQASRGLVFRQCQDYQIDSNIEALEDKWLQDLLHHGVAKVNQHMDRFEIGEALDVLFKLFWDDFCSWYLEIVKNRLWGEKGEASKRQAQTQLLLAIETFYKLLHPFVPFVTEMLWQEMKELREQSGEMLYSETILFASWPQEKDFACFETEKEHCNTLRDIANTVFQMRSQQPGISENTKLPSLLVSGLSAEQIALLSDSWDGLARFLKIENITAHETVEKPDLCAVGVSGQIQLYLPLEGVVDIGAEKERLLKQIEKVNKGIQSYQSKLSNEKFTKKAPAQLVEQTKELLFQEQKTLETLQANLSALN